jgi:hypothetical protein
MLTTPKWSNHLAEEEEPGLSTGNNQDTQNTMAMGKIHAASLLIHTTSLFFSPSVNHYRENLMKATIHS